MSLPAILVLGAASLYGTTDAFLERLGLNSIDELPPLGQFVPGADVVEALENTLMVNPDTSADAAAAELDDSAFDVAAMAAAALADDYGEDRADNDDAGTNDPRVEGADGDDFQALELTHLGVHRTATLAKKPDRSGK